MAKFNLQKWSAVAEILSSVAVLATLVFLVLEIRQANDAVRANTYQGLNAVVQDFNAMFIFSVILRRMATTGNPHTTT